MTNEQIIISCEPLRQALQAHRAMREWIMAAPEPTISMPGIDGDWLDDVEGMLVQALERPVVKPVAWIRREARSWLAAEGYCTAYSSPPCDHPVPLYTAPQAQQPAIAKAKENA